MRLGEHVEGSDASCASPAASFRCAAQIVLPIIRGAAADDDDSSHGDKIRQAHQRKIANVEAAHKRDDMTDGVGNIRCPVTESILCA